MPGRTSWPPPPACRRIHDFASYLAALRQRHDYFARDGLPAVGRGLEQICARPYGDGEIRRIFEGTQRTPPTWLKFKSAMLVELR